MNFFRNLSPARWLKWSTPLTFGAIAVSLLLLLAIPLLGSYSAQAQKTFEGTPARKPAYLDRLIAEVDKDGDRLIAIYKDIHQNPELQFNETRTAAIVAKGFGLY